MAESHGKGQGMGNRLRPVLRRIVPASMRRQLFNFREARQAPDDWRRLVRAFPELEDYATLAERARTSLESNYHRYLTEVSIPSMAISIELATFLLVACRLFRPRKILDLGSGFSSAVFLHYAATSTTEVDLWSIDDSEEWLARTDLFARKVGLVPMRLLPWQDFLRRREERFDLVLHDLGSMKTRLATLPDVLGRVNSGGLVVLDDMHKQPYNSAARRAVKRHCMTLISLRAVTLDQISRYSMLAIPT